METIIKKEYFSNSRIFLSSLLFFIGGIFSRLLLNFWERSFVWPLFWFFLLPFVSGIFFFKNKNRIFLALCFGAAGFLIGWAKADGELGKNYQREEKDFQGQVVVWNEPEKTSSGMKMEVKKIDFTREKILFLSRDQLNFQVGDVLEIHCSLQNPEKIENWNYPLSLASENIYQLCQKASGKKVGVFDAMEKDWPQWEYGRLVFLRKSYAWRKILEAKIYQRLSFPESGFLAGLILGGDDRLDKETQEAFRRAGLSHLVAVSGYNISLLGAFLMGGALLLGLWRSQAFWLAAAGIIFFVLSIGTPASALRAAIMGILVLYAAKIGRLAGSLRILLLTASLMLFFSPLMLFYDAGFQLSFLATLALTTFYADWREKLGIEKDFLELKSIFLTTVVAQFGVLGILLFSFQSISLVSLLANLLILPIIPWLTLGGFGLIFLEFIFPWGAQFFAPLLWLGLHWEISVAKFFASWQWAEMKVENLGPKFLVVYYGFFLLLFWWTKRGRRKNTKDKKSNNN